MRKRIWVLWLGMGIGLELPAAASAGTHYVPGDYTTITTALAEASVGDTIQVAPGLYSPSSNGESFPLRVDKDSLCLLGAGMDLSIIDAELDSIVLECIGSIGSRISGFSVTGGLATRGAGIWVKSTALVEIDHNLIHGNRSNFQGAGLLTDSDSWIHHNVVWENFDADTTDDSDPHGMVARGDSRALIEHNLVGRGDGNGLAVSGIASPTVRHNIFYQNGTPPPNGRGRGICWLNSLPPIVYHNLFFENVVAALLVPELGGNYSGEDANDLFADDSIFGNLDADPLLVDPDNANFHLSWGSPAIDAGDPTLPGDPDGTVADIGPFYYDQTAVGVASDAPPSRLTLSSAPNPFNPATTLRFVVSEAGLGSLIIFDIRGREIISLMEGHLQAGAHRIPWDGRDAFGEAVPSGAYFARLRAGDGVRKLKITLIR